MGGYYVGYGYLIGYSTFTKDNEQFHTYYLLMGEIDKHNDLYDTVTLVKITQAEQTLKEIRKGQKVWFEHRNINGKPFFCNAQPTQF